MGTERKEGSIPPEGNRGNITRRQPLSWAWKDEKDLIAKASSEEGHSRLRTQHRQRVQEEVHNPGMHVA